MAKLKPAFWVSVCLGQASAACLGGIAPRFRRDGVPDCPGAHSGTGVPLVSEEALRGLTREFGRGLDDIRREFEALRDRDK